MLNKRRKNRVPLVFAGVGLLALILGATVTLPKSGNWFGQWLGKSHSQQEQNPQAINTQSAVLPLVALSKAERAEKLQAIAKGSESEDRNRARYLLASDLVDKDEGKKALSFLDGLEKDYPQLAPYILLKQAQAYELTGATEQTTKIREQVIKDYPKDFASVKALYLLGQSKPEYLETAIAKFPSHPLSWEAANQRLKANPNQPQLQLLLAKYAYDQAYVVPVLDELAGQSKGGQSETATLKPEDWETVASAYWGNTEFAKAAQAYAKAPRTARNLYRTGRGYQVANKSTEATAAYKELAKDFPDARETGMGLIRLAELTKSGPEAIPYLDQVVSKFPDKAGEALVKKADILNKSGNSAQGAEALKLLVDKYGNSDAAAEYRWKVAQAKAKANDLQSAWQWAEAIPTQNPDSILAPRAGFWIGKWATKLGKQQDAKTAFEYVLSQFPYSYYAWRSAATLGLNVGNFNTVREMNPKVVTLQRSVPPAGSKTFKELYLLGQDRDAWLLWEAEFQNKAQPTVPEQFTEGLLRLAKGENLQGMAKVSTLEDRETPQEKAEYQSLSKQLMYWQARYPFPYAKEIETWSQKRQLNPLLVTALMRQESRFEAKVHSPVGAVGLMQVMPSTAKWIAPQIKMQEKDYNLEIPNDNIMMGTWFLDSTHKQYKNNSLLAVTSYNAGPGNVSKWVQTINKTDPDEFVEAIPFEETKNYARQVFGNYWNYLRLYNPETNQLMTKYSTEHVKLPNH